VGWGLSVAQLIPVLNTFGYLRRTQSDSVEAEAAFRESRGTLRRW
jgi:hypothetical protein